MRVCLPVTCLSDCLSVRPFFPVLILAAVSGVEALTSSPKDSEFKIVDDLLVLVCDGFFFVFDALPIACDVGLVLAEDTTNEGKLFVGVHLTPMSYTCFAVS